MKRTTLWILALVAIGCAGHASWADAPLAVATSQIAPPATMPTKVGEQVTSEDAVLWDFHALGPVNGVNDLYRSASPLRDLEKRSTAPSDAAVRAQAKARLQRLYDKGIRTIISFEQQPDSAPATASAPASEDKAHWVALEREMAAKVGINYISHPLANSGKGSIQDISDADLIAFLQKVDADVFKSAAKGGVDIHCSAGHDRTGIFVAYLRMRYCGWTAEQAIAEMRSLGHNWPKFSANGGISSWHEEHLRAIETRVKAKN